MTDETTPQQTKPKEEGYPSAYEIVRAEGFTDEEFAAMKPEQLERAIKEQYGNLRRIWRSYDAEKKEEVKEPFAFFTDERAKFEVSPTFDFKNERITKLKGSLESIKYNNEGKRDYYNNHQRADITLTPIYDRKGLIYEFKGYINWTGGKSKGIRTPLLIYPVYEVPSGRIINFTHFFLDSWIFSGCKILYHDFEIKVPTKKTFP
jgi:hypothetical protein